MTTYHVELKGYCDVIVEANSEEEAFDRAVEMIPSSSLSIETAEVKGVLEGQALEMAHRYFPEHLPATKTYQELPDGSSILVTERCEPSEAGKAGRYHGNQWEQELLKRKVSGEKLDRIEEDFLRQRGYSGGDEVFHAQDPTRLLKDDETVEGLEQCCENGDQLSSRQYQILYTNSLLKLQRLAGLVETWAKETN